MKVLAFDTSNMTMAVGLMEDQKVLATIQTMTNRTHSKTLMPAIQNLMTQVGWVPTDIDRVVVAKGPGSYTGLRIAVTTAKTLADTLSCELVGISSLKVLAANCIGRKEWIVPLFDARRQNVYTVAYKWQEGELITALSDQHLSLSELKERLDGQAIYFVGSDIEKFKDQLVTDFPQAILNDVSAWNYPCAISLAQLGQKETPEIDKDAFLPTYLKRVEAEEKWLEHHKLGEESYVEKI